MAGNIVNGVTPAVTAVQYYTGDEDNSKIFYQDDSTYPSKKKSIFGCTRNDDVNDIYFIW